MLRNTFFRIVLLFTLLCAPLMVSAQSCPSTFYGCSDCGGNLTCFYGQSGSQYYLGSSYEYAHCTVTTSYCSSADDCYWSLAQVRGVCPDGTTTWSYLSFCCWKPWW